MTSHLVLLPGRIILYQQRLLVVARVHHSTAQALDSWGNSYALLLSPLGWVADDTRYRLACCSWQTLPAEMWLLIESFLDLWGLTTLWRTHPYWYDRREEMDPRTGISHPYTGVLEALHRRDMGLLLYYHPLVPPWRTRNLTYFPDDWHRNRSSVFRMAVECNSAPLARLALSGSRWRRPPPGLSEELEDELMVRESISALLSRVIGGDEVYGGARALLNNELLLECAVRGKWKVWEIAASHTWEAKWYVLDLVPDHGYCLARVRQYAVQVHDERLVLWCDITGTLHGVRHVFDDRLVEPQQHYLRQVLPSMSKAELYKLFNHFCKPQNAVAYCLLETILRARQSKDKRWQVLWRKLQTLRHQVAGYGRLPW
jgi:hypothetical protein